VAKREARKLKLGILVQSDFQTAGICDRFRRNFRRSASKVGENFAESVQKIIEINFSVRLRYGYASCMLEILQIRDSSLFRRYCI